MEKLYYATCQLFFEDILEQELKRLGATTTERSVGGLFFTCTEAVLYNILIHARTIAALRLVLAQGTIEDPKDLYQQALAIAWFEHFSGDETLACRVSSSGRNIAPENFLMLVMKDGIVDSFRKIGRPRPNIDLDRANHFVHLQVTSNEIVITLELEHELFKRGYRTSLNQDNQELAQVKLIKKRKVAQPANHTHPSPLKEHLAAALIYRSQWHLQNIEEPVLFYDPMCGSGTLLIEAFMISHQMSPQWLRKEWRIKKWKGYNAQLFEAAWQAMQQQVKEALLNSKLEFWASDINEHAIAMTRLALGKLGIVSNVKLFNQNFFDTKTPAKAGFIVSNPPYGERMGSREEANRLYANIGKHLKTYYQCWQVALLAPDSDILRCLDMRAEHINTFYNGAKRAVFLRFSIEDREERRFELSERGRQIESIMSQKFAKHQELALREYNTNAFRFYNSDSADFMASCEYFNGAVVVQEYPKRRDKDGQVSNEGLRTAEFLHIVQAVTDLHKMDIYHKSRRPAANINQYAKEESVDSVRKEVKEGDLRFMVDLSTYIDVGLYLDHRWLRRELLATAKDKSFLNLFAYTASMSVAAAVGGAKRTLSVDASKTYLGKARDNFRLNEVDLESKAHGFVRSDVKKFMNNLEEKFDIIAIDPPTFSNGKGRDVLDIQKDHPKMIEQLMRCLEDDGKLYFSTHYRRFKLDAQIIRRFDVQDITKISHDKDFDERTEHFMWVIQHRR